MPWDGTLENLPMLVIPAGTELHHGTDCAGDFEIPDGPAWFASTHEVAAEWAGWNYPAHDRADGERRTHAHVTLADLRLVDLDAVQAVEDGWDRLCLAVAGIDDELTREELAAAFAQRGLAGWAGEEELLIVSPDKVLRFVGRIPVPGENPLRPVPSTYLPPAAGLAA